MFKRVDCFDAAVKRALRLQTDAQDDRYASLSGLPFPREDEREGVAAIGARVRPGRWRHRAKCLGVVLNKHSDFAYFRGQFHRMRARQGARRARARARAFDVRAPRLRRIDCLQRSGKPIASASDGPNSPMPGSTRRSFRRKLSLHNMNKSLKTGDWRGDVRNRRDTAAATVEPMCIDLA
jgi:hypothetical protein